MPTKYTSPGQDLTIIHKPLGDEHPYDQKPYERFPRNPIAGEAVILGAVTNPAGAADRVWASWQIEGSPEHGESRAAKNESSDDGDIWRVELPKILAGRTFSYTLYAENQSQVAESATFSFIPDSWHFIDAILAVGAEPNSLKMLCGLEGSETRILMTFALDTPKLLRFIIESTAGDPGEYKLKDVSTLKDRTLQLESDELSLEITHDPVRIDVRRHDGEILLRENKRLAVLLDGDQQPLEVRQAFHSPIDEAFYGFGERFNALNQRGQELDTRVYDQFTQQGLRSYIPVPFSISSKGYGFYLATSQVVTFDLAASDSDSWSYRVGLGADRKLECFIIADRNPMDQISTFISLTAPQAVPPIWAFGPWMSGNEWNSQDIVMEQLRKTIEYRIPSTVLVIEAWSDESTFYIWNDAQYEPRPSNEAFALNDFSFPEDGHWPDPKAMIERLHDEGIRLVLWQIPVLKELDEPHPQHDHDWEYMIEKGYCVTEDDGAPYRVRPFWFHDGLLLDPTNKAAVEWWLSKRAYLFDEMGVDGFKTDGGEHLWGTTQRFAGGRADDLMNQYPNLYIKAYHDFAIEKRSGDALTFSRAGYTGAQATPCHWGGDQKSTWEDLRSTILAGLSAGMAGIAFWGFDIGGFTGEIPSAELYLHSAGLAVFSPIMQYHHDFNQHRKPARDRSPWNIQERTRDERVIPTYRFFANLRMNLLPFIFSEAKRCAARGLPMMRAMPIAFPDDLAALDHPYQFTFGDDLLVAPVVEPDQENWPVYLPEGFWFNFWTGERVEGGALHVEPTPIDRIPVFVRAGAMLPLNLGKSISLGDPVGNRVDQYQELCLAIYPGDSMAYTWYDDVSKSTYLFQCDARDPGHIVLQIPELPHAIHVLIGGISPNSVYVNGTEITHGPDRSRLPSWTLRGNVWTASIHLPAGDNRRTLLIQ